MRKVPAHIECFDNSNLFGSHPVAACVIYKNGKPKKSDYRHFNIKTVSGINDFASMEEIVYRRYKRLIDEKQPLPQLIIIDGGKGQLNAALKSLKKLNINNDIVIIGIAKRLEEIFSPGDSIPLYLDKNSPSLKLIQQIRNEAHRFGISFHRGKRNKSMLFIELERLKGIGKETIEKLLKHFGSIDNVSKAQLNELEKIVDRKKSSIIWKHYHG
jgi:excinuclease ABC subunit C